MTRTVNETKTRAAAFVREWQVAPTAREATDAQTRKAGFFPISAVERSRRMRFERALNFTNIRNPIELSKWFCD